MGNREYEFLVAIHEMIEQFLCENAGITDEAITNFDIEYEKNRREGDNTEPGEDIYAPYHKQHMFAEKIEKLMAEECNINWEDYCKYSNRFYEKRDNENL
jgi:Mn-dependent DtxR family transcriptional regulator